MNGNRKHQERNQRYKEDTNGNFIAEKHSNQSKIFIDELSGRKQVTDEIVIYRDQRKLPNLNNTGNSRLKNKILNERRHKNPQQYYQIEFSNV